MSTKKSTGSNFVQYKWSDFITDVVSQPSFFDAKVSIQYETNQEIRIRKIKKIFSKYSTE